MKKINDITLNCKKNIFYHLQMHLISCHFLIICLWLECIYFAFVKGLNTQSGGDQLMKINSSQISEKMYFSSVVKLEVPPKPAFKILTSAKIGKERKSNVKKWKFHKKSYIWEVNGLYQGDIALPKGKLDLEFPIVISLWIWPGGIVPYYIEKENFSDKHKRNIVEAMHHIERRSCVYFRPYKETDEDYLWITGSKGKGCSSFVGRQDNGQELALEAELCTTRETILHELMHALGFTHQHSALFRDKYIKVFWNNIQRGKEEYFLKDPAHPNSGIGIGYDYSSVMHFSAYAFSSKGAPTLKPKVKNTKLMKRKWLSKKDTLKLRRTYKCEQN